MFYMGVFCSRNGGSLNLCLLGPRGCPLYCWTERVCFKRKKKTSLHTMCDSQCHTQQRAHRVRGLWGGTLSEAAQLRSCYAQQQNPQVHPSPALDRCGAAFHICMRGLPLVQAGCAPDKAALSFGCTTQDRHPSTRARLLLEPPLLRQTQGPHNARREEHKKEPELFRCTQIWHF